jgi:prepilin-type N-terminal cleavage/methylation domain-containing protein
MKRRYDGFTLIEMLVVILIILLLSGMLFKIASLVSGKAARAKAVADIAKLESALAEYYAEYNIYPPTSGVAYQYENSGGQPDGLRNMLKANNNPDNPGFVTDSGERVVDKNREWGQSTKGSIGYSYGLVSYLWPRAQGGQAHWYDRDTERDTAAKKKWAHYLDDLDVHHYGVEVHNTIGGTAFIYTNSVMTVRDPWDRDYQYQCKPPYMQYKLWSKGPDGKSGTGDDINNDAFNE